MKVVVKSIAVLCLLFVSTARGEDSDSWGWKVVPYLWGVNIDGTMAVGPVEEDLDVSFSDILSNMDFGGSIFISAGKGAHGFHIDYTYLRLKPDAVALPSPPFFPDSSVQPKLTINILEGAYHWRFADAQKLIVGVRYTDMEMRMSIEFTGPAPFDPDPLTAGPSFVDFFVGLYSSHRISQSWDFDVYGTVGAGDSDLPWTLQTTFARRFSNNNRLHLGARVWGLDYSDNENSLSARANLDATMYGLVIGYEFN